MKRLVLLICAVAGCTATLEPIFGEASAGTGGGGGTDAETLTGAETDGGSATGTQDPSPVVVVEPFDYHYPDEGTYMEIADRITLQATLGEVESASFVYVADRDIDELVALPPVLAEPGGLQLADDAVDVQVVVFQARDGAGLGSLAWEGGIQRGDAAADDRGLHRDARERAPLVPCVLVGDVFAYEAAVATGAQLISLPTAAMGGTARTSVASGEGRQFWVTVTVPADLELPETSTRFEGAIALSADGDMISVPVELDVLALRLDPLAQHGVHVGAKRTTEDAPPQFEAAIFGDVAATGANAFRGELDVPGDYEALSALGVEVALNLNTLTTPETTAVQSQGFEPYIYDNNTTVAASADVLVAAHDVGALYAGTEDFEFLTDLIAMVGAPDYWAYSVTDPERTGDPAFDQFLAYLDQLADDPSARLAPVEAHAEDTLPAHAPLRTRLMTGFWLFGSGLDGAVLWGYTQLGSVNPHTDPNYVGVVLPVLRDGTEPALLGTYTRAAFREGIDDLRYALTVSRMISEARRADLRALFDDELARYAKLFVEGDRIDYRNTEADLRRTRERLFGWATELAAP